MASKVSVDLSEFRKIPKAGCRFAQLDLKEEHVEKLKAVMQSDEYSASEIHRVMVVNWKYSIGKESVAKHRNGTCPWVTGAK